jgi:protein-arginine deiminase
MHPRPKWKASLLIGVSAALLACGGLPGVGDTPDSGIRTETPDGGDPEGPGDPDGGETINEVSAPVVDLRADVNRDGVVTLDDADEDLDEETWSASRGAIFLANLDDDQDRCTYSSTKSDVDLARCNDAADDEINGDADLLDLAYLRTVPWPASPCRRRRPASCACS